MTRACLWVIVDFTVNVALGGIYLVLLFVAMKANILYAVDDSINALTSAFSCWLIS